MTMPMEHDLPPVARNSDPDTSHIAERMIRSKRVTHMLVLLRQYGRFASQTEGLSDFTAANWAGVTHHSATKRCADLRNAGLIERVGTTKVGGSHMPQMQCKITEEGKRVLALTKAGVER
jgi:hypothetical protein